MILLFFLLSSINAEYTNVFLQTDTLQRLPVVLHVQHKNNVIEAGECKRDGSGWVCPINVCPLP